MEDLLLFVVLLVPLLYLQRFLQREIQSIFLLVTHQPEISMALFSILFLPGVVLHETSHYLMAHLLRVKTGRFSLIPRKVGGGRIQLGYVETAQADFFRDALIGAAPLIAGGVFIAFAGVSILKLNLIWADLNQFQASAIIQALKAITARPDFWVWFYLMLTISSTMMPSASDRKAWLPLALVIGIVTATLLILGAGPWVYSHLALITKAAMDVIIFILGITVVIHLLLLPPAWLLRKMISRISGYHVV